MSRATVWLLVVVMWVLAGCTIAPPKDMNPRPEEVVARLKVPEGFEVNVFAAGLGRSRMMVVGEDGTVYLSHWKEGRITALQDRDGDGRAEKVWTVLKGPETMHGLAIREGKLYICSEHELMVAPILADGNLGEARTILTGLPNGGMHPKRTMVFDRQGRLLISIGAQTNDAHEWWDEELATIIRVNADGSGREIFARGLRNTIGFDFHPETGELWGFDIGADWRGDNVPPEELNRLVAGGHYGFPFVHGRGMRDEVRMFWAGFSAEEAEKTIEPVLTYQAHASPIGFLFYTGKQFPAEYRHDGFAAMRGSWNRSEPVGYKVVRVRFRDGEPVGFEDFVTGWLDAEAGRHYGRISGLAQAKDGSLLVADDDNGVVYRVAVGEVRSQKPEARMGKPEARNPKPE